MGGKKVEMFYDEEPTDDVSPSEHLLDILVWENTSGLTGAEQRQAKLNWKLKNKQKKKHLKTRAEFIKETLALQHLDRRVVWTNKQKRFNRSI